MEHKRGDTFEYAAVLPSDEFADWVPTCQVRDGSDQLIANVAATWTSDTAINLLVADTSNWKLGSARFDIRLERPADGYVRTTNPVDFTIVETVTRP